MILGFWLGQNKNFDMSPKPEALAGHTYYLNNATIETGIGKVLVYCVWSQRMELCLSVSMEAYSYVLAILPPS